MDIIADYCIAEHNVRVVFAENGKNNTELLPSFEPFKKEGSNDDFLFTLRVDDTLPPVDKNRRERIDTFETGNGDTVVDLLDNGGYQYIVKDIHGRSCCLLQTNKDFSEGVCALNGDFQMRQFGLNNALMMLYAFRGSFFDTLLIHASLVRNGGYGYAFTAKSGTGKSTHTQLWLDNIPGSDLMNDDNPVVRVVDEGCFIYGSPWSGKTPCYRDVKAPLGAVTRIDRSSCNSIERLGPVEAFASMLPSVSSMKWDIRLYRNVYGTITRILERVPVYTLHCLPDRNSAEVCHECITRDKSV